MERAYYRGYWIVYEPKPIPAGRDWNWWHDDYDGAEDSGDHRSGFAGSEAEARAAIDEQIAEAEE